MAISSDLQAKLDAAFAAHDAAAKAASDAAAAHTAADAAAKTAADADGNVTTALNSALQTYKDVVTELAAELGQAG